jgi:catechol 2,3-dioxygenase-like lactoylglutathione lyase family enzyme
MDQRISLVTLAVADLDATRRFYLEGLGWESFIDVPGDVLMIQAGEHLLLSFWVEPHFEAEVGPIRRGPGVAPITIAHNLGSDAEVDAVLEAARAAGADPVHEAERRDWGGYSGYFGDPDGYRWEIAHVTGEIKELVVPQ